MYKSYWLNAITTYARDRWQQFTSINIKTSMNGKNLVNNNSDSNFFDTKFSFLQNS